MKVIINDAEFALTGNISAIPLDELLQHCDATPPYAVALNGEFVPQTAYCNTRIQTGDSLDIVSPIFGG